MVPTGTDMGGDTRCTPHRWVTRARQALLGSLMLCSAALAQGTAPKIFTCEAEWAALARELMPGADVFSATQSSQDPHHIEARPGLIARMRSAELVICTGAGLEDGWLPVLQQRSGNRAVQDGRPGMFFAAAHVATLDAAGSAGSLNPFAGDVHPEGNPHVHGDPERLLQVAQALSLRMAQLWPDQAESVRTRHSAFQQRWTRLMDQWRHKAAPLRGVAVAAQHSHFAYWWHWLGMRQTLDLEPKPGLPPTPGHLQSLLGQWRSQVPVAIVVAQHQDARSARWLSERAQPTRPVLVLPATVPDEQSPQALERWFDAMIESLLNAAARAAATGPRARDAAQ